MAKETKSNVVRLAALQNKKLENNSQSRAVHQALAEKSFNKTIKFDDSDNECSSKKQIFQDILADVDESMCQFLEKPHFLGKKGEKLMTVQSKIGPDERFQLDSRFQSESENESQSEDEQTVELKNEQGLMYNIMNTVLDEIGVNPGKQHPSFENQHNIDKFVRFDPCDSAHDKYLIKNDTNVSVIEPTEIQTKDFTDEAMPLVDERTYFEVNSDFNKVLKPNALSGGADGFKFDFNIDKYQTPPLQNISTENYIVRELQQDSSDNDECFDKTAFSEKLTPKLKQFFFFSLNPRFQMDIPLLFKRDKSMEEIDKKWLSNRQELTIEYKKRHKDSIRFQKKFCTKT